MARHVARWLAWWIAAFGLWFLLVGEWTLTEVVAGAAAATATATIAAALGAVTPPVERPALPDLATAWTVPVMFVADFGIVVLALVRSAARRQVVRGRFVARPGTADAWRSYAATISANAYVVDVDAERRLTLFHDLIPFRKSEEPAP